VEAPGELPLSQLAVVGLGLGAEGEEAGEQVLVVGTSFVCTDGCGVLGVLEVTASFIGTQMLGDEGVAVIETKTLRRE